MDIIEAGFPVASEGDFLLGPADCPGNRDARSQVLPGQTLKTSTGPGRPSSDAAHPAHPYLPVLFGHSPEVSAPKKHGTKSCKRHASRRSPRRPVHEQRRILCHGCHADGLGLSLCQVVEAVIEAGRHDGQHPRHGGLHHARRIRCADRLPVRKGNKYSRRPSSPSTATTTWASPWPIRWPP